MARNWAITIGINHYRNLQPLNFAKRDAEAMQTYLLREIGCQTVNHFSDDSPPIPQDYGAPLNSQPTYGTLRRFLRVRFEQPFLKAGDNLWFFFAGHGIRHEDRDYLMPLDGDPGDVANTTIPLHYVTERLQRCGADNVILLIDACRSSGRRSGLGIGEERQPGVITFFSCSPQESSYEIEALQQGAFTHALLAGLRLQGEGNCATVERLYHYLVQNVPEINAQHNRPRQTPYGRIEPLTKKDLILIPRKATVSDVMVLKYTAANAEFIEKNLTLAEQFWTRVLVVSPADPEAIAGIKRLAQNSAPTIPEPQPIPKRSLETLPPPEPPPPIQPKSPEPPPPVQTRYQLDPLGEPPRVQVEAPQFEFEVVTVNAQGEIIHREQRSVEYYREDLGNSVILDLLKIPNGIFMMGSPNGEGESAEKPQHEVTVAPFLMGKYPVTQTQWRVVAALPKVARDLEVDPSKFKGDNRPVEQVSWDDAMEFCQRLSQKTGREYRLPSEAEWEYACRARTKTKFYFGGALTLKLAKCKANLGIALVTIFTGETAPVGSYLPNAFGLYDMHGNVWEWCADHWHNSYEGAPTNGSTWLSSGENNLRLVRGGSWGLSPRCCRSADRDRNARDNRVSVLGFRVVCASS